MTCCYWPAPPGARAPGSSPAQPSCSPGGPDSPARHSALLLIIVWLLINLVPPGLSIHLTKGQGQRVGGAQGERGAIYRAPGEASVDWAGPGAGPLSLQLLWAAAAGVLQLLQLLHKGGGRAQRQLRLAAQVARDARGARHWNRKTFRKILLSNLQSKILNEGILYLFWLRTQIKTGRDDLASVGQSPETNPTKIWTRRNKSRPGIIRLRTLYLMTWKISNCVTWSQPLYLSVWSSDGEICLSTWKYQNINAGDFESQHGSDHNQLSDK